MEQFFLATGAIEQSVQSALTFIQTVDYLKVKQQTVQSTLTFSQTISEEVTVPTAIIEESVYQSLIFNQTIGLAKAIVRIINHVLTFNDTLEKRIPFTQTILPDQIVHIPAISVVKLPKKRKCTTVLSVPDLNIVLPCPLLGDSQSLLSSLVVKRTMTGQTYTYVKQSDANKLVYTFQINRNKAVELRNFIKLNLSKMINMINFKGENWLVNITNNPISLISKGLRKECGEFVEVQMEFQGIKLF